MISVWYQLFELEIYHHNILISFLTRVEEDSHSGLNFSWKKKHENQQLWEIKKTLFVYPLCRNDQFVVECSCASIIQLQVFDSPTIDCDCKEGEGGGLIGGGGLALLTAWGRVALGVPKYKTLIFEHNNFSQRCCDKNLARFKRLNLARKEKCSTTLEPLYREEVVYFIYTSKDDTKLLDWNLLKRKSILIL